LAPTRPSLPLRAVYRRQIRQDEHVLIGRPSSAISPIVIAKEFTSISASDVLDLATNSVAEGRMLEYKQALPTTWSDDDKREFLVDISSFGNAVGGDLIYGI
jgi:hypothetical protein